MRVKLFEVSWSVDLPKLESQINEFLGKLRPGAVTHVTQSSHGTRTGDTDQMEDGYCFAIWYED